MDDTLDIEALRQSIRDVLATEAASERVHRHYDSGEAFDASLRRNAQELGWASLGVSEANGGLGLGLPALAALYEELGRGPAPLPLEPTLIVAQALDAAAPGQGQDAALGAIVAGEKLAAFALDCTWQAGADGQVTGTVAHIVDGAAADLFLLCAADGKALLVERGAAGVNVEAHPAVDHTRSFATVTLAGARPVALDIDLPALLDHAALAIAADSMGGASEIFARTIEYLKTRVQFGKPIGSFQALKHRAADHQLRLKHASAVLSAAVGALGTARQSSLLALAKATCADVYATIADDAVQLHGGIGYTWEQDCHIFVKRARTSQMIYGDSLWWLDRAADLLVEAA